MKTDLEEYAQDSWALDNFTLEIYQKSNLIIVQNLVF